MAFCAPRVGWDAAGAIALHNIAVYLDAKRPQTVNHTKTRKWLH